MTSLFDAIDDFTLGAHADDWRAAVRLAGDGLVRGGVTTPDYTDEMIAAIDEHGPYVVIAPGLALAHARPSPAVHRAGLSWVQLAEPVAFGSAHGDPVRLVIGLAAVDHDSHIQIMSALATALADPEALDRLERATTKEDVRTLLANENGAPS